MSAKLKHKEGTYLTNKMVINSNIDDKLSSGYFPAVQVLKADVSEHCVGSIFNRW